MTPRLARTDETAALWRIRNLAIRHGCQSVYPAEVITAWTPDALPEGYFEAVRGNPFYVVDDPDYGVAATGFLDLTGGSVEAIFTLPVCNGKGYASAIMQTLMMEARQRGFSQLTLAATPNACGFYQRHGFSIVRESLYHSALAGAALPCVEMVREL
ncbi:GNAT family N-acetyltransferase [Pantoea phytobeneficialis]|uniref:GNAT family N-acetyltransferase n=1 Tax=Pantoea phytobeneficialis TaxID=2052056 RepID=A0AAP9KR85_9GAMM|nr:GNAT family N-acetyltransferase [Pantoea phytobeneficialis]MDO6409018.1 GNAT family N-acetyltransferase [Pantoea phytobeneficialis]QGR08846.1 GNAT family N-acetyltransferase [Pantoea phytobeneficialis]